MSTALVFYLGALVGSVVTFGIVALFSIGEISDHAYRSSRDLSSSPGSGTKKHEHEPS